MEPINVNLSCDLQHPVKVRYLDGYFFSKDSAGHKINVDVFNNGVPVSVGGSVSADVIRSDGETVPVTGAVSENRAYVILPQAAYAVVGAAQITIKVTEGTTIVTIASFVVYVHESDTGIIVDPGTIIPSIQALISQIETAVASIPADYSSLWTSLAPAFSSSTAYAVGQYVTNSGVLYRFTTAHPAGTWNSAHVTAVNLGAEVSNLKSAISELDDSVFVYSPLEASATSSGWTLTGSGGSRQYSGNSLVKYSVKAGQKLYLKLAKDWSTSADSQGVYQWQNSSSVPGSDSNQYLIGSPVTNAVDGVVTVPIGATYLIVSQKSDNSTNQVKLTEPAWEIEIAELESKFETTETKTPSATSSNWTLTGSGGSRSYSGNSLAKYQVVAGDKMYLKIAKDWSASSDSQGVYQWQNNASVPSSNTNQYLIGDPVTVATDGIVTVPTGATYLIVSQKSDNTTNLVQKISFAWDADIARIDSEIVSINKNIFTSDLNENFKKCNVSAHAGASNDVYAINSMPGFKNAIAHGDRMVECDVRITSDGVPVLFHDETLKSSNIADYTGDPIYVGALTYAQTQAYNLPKSSGKIPRLLDALLLCKKHGVILEIDLAGKTWKSDASTTIMTQAQALKAVIDVVDSCGMRKNVFLTIEYSGSTSQVSALIPITTDIAIGVSNRTSASSISAISSVISTFPLVICSIGENYTDSDLMTAIKNAGENCKAKAFTLNTSADIDAAINAGVSYCLSNVITQDTYDEYTLT